MSPSIRLTADSGDRFARFDSIEWWDRDIIQSARVLVIGAGALGNEVIKNLSLLGIGHLVIVDMDQVESSNLCRSVLFREDDCGKAKSECAAAAAKALYPGIAVTAIRADVLCELGLGYFRWAQVVIGALDNREARVFVNAACARVATPWVDGGIDVLNGVVRVFSPPATACYECTMGDSDWQLLNSRRSCSQIARRSIENQGQPTTPTTASIIGALQVQEVVKMLHRMPVLSGQGFLLEGLNHTSSLVTYPIKPECPWHETPIPIATDTKFDRQTQLRQVADAASKTLGGFDAIEFGRELVSEMECPNCANRRSVLRQPLHLQPNETHCSSCGTECVPNLIHGLAAGSSLLDRHVSDFDLPLGDIIWARYQDNAIGFQLDGLRI